MKYEITCINKSDRSNSHERIKAIGNNSWHITQKQAIEYIKSGQYSFYVRVHGKAVNVVVAKSRFGHEYIKTEADGEQPNNLLSLPECK